MSASSVWSDRLIRIRFTPQNFASAETTDDLPAPGSPWRSTGLLPPNMALMRRPKLAALVGAFSENEPVSPVAVAVRGNGPKEVGSILAPSRAFAIHAWLLNTFSMTDGDTNLVKNEKIERYSILEGSRLSIRTSAAP